MSNVTGVSALQAGAKEGAAPLAAQPLAQPSQPVAQTPRQPAPQPAQPPRQPAPQPMAPQPMAAQPMAAQPVGTGTSDAWYVKTSDGADYGPVPRAELEHWVTEERIDSTCQILQQGWSQWKWADEVFPQLATTQAQATQAVNPFAGIVDSGPGPQPFAGREATGRPSGGAKASADAGRVQRVDAGLKISYISLIVSGVGFFLAFVGMFGSIQVVASMFGGGPRAGEFKAVTILVIWGGSAMIGGLWAHFAGMCTCMETPRSLGGNQQISIAVAAFGVFIFLAHSPVLLAAAEVESPTGYQAVIWLSLMAQKVSFVALAFFLTAFAKYAPKAKLDTHAMAYSGIEGASAIWMTLVTFEAISPQSIGPKTIMAIFMVFGTVSYGYIVFLIATARKALKKV